jgi:uncharacterized membrane protein YecN with MAPEG domain
MTRIPVTLFTSGVLGLLCVLLSVLVSVVRTRTKVLIGDGAGTPAAALLLPAIRAHGNFIEYVPIALILLGGIEVSGASRLTVEIFAGMLILGRIAHAIGIQKSGPDALRGIGALLTWLVILGLSIEALLLLL